MRTPHKMRQREADELARLFSQLMRDLGARQRNPVEWELRARHGPARVSLIASVPVFYARTPDGLRRAHAPPIGKAVDVFVPFTTWISEFLALH